MNGWDQKGVSHLTEKEKKWSASYLHANPDLIQGPPTGVLMGEMPPTLDPDWRLFPWPSNSIGGRILKAARIPVEVFLGKLQRINLFSAHCDWDDDQAVERASYFHNFQPEGMRVVLCGKRVGLAFGFNKYFSVLTVDGISYTTIPDEHREYTKALARVGTRTALLWATNTLRPIK